jgi:hypothetical protein
MDWLALAEKFQTAIVGAVGFAGVIATLVTNARVARLAREATINHEREALRIALREELKVAHNGLVMGERNFQLADQPAGELLIPTQSMTAIFNELLDKLGLLGGDQLQQTLDAYLSLQQMNSTLLLFGRRSQDGQWIVLPTAHRGEAAKIYAGLIPKVASAITVLGGVVEA